MRGFIEDNCKHWEELAELHPETDYYDIEGVLDENPRSIRSNLKNSVMLRADHCFIRNVISASIRCRGRVAWDIVADDGW